MNLRRFLGIAILLALSLPFAAAKTSFETAAWTKPAPPFRIAGNLYYVGSEDLAAYLIVTPQGDILINSNLESSVPLIKQSVEALGFKFSDIKILLISHGHFDHCAGSAALLKLTGAKYYVMDADVSVVESGGKTDFAYGAQADMQFPTTHVDRVLHDGSKVSLGGTTLTAHLTAGHTKGTTTWTLDEPAPDQANARPLQVVIVGSPNVNAGYKLVGNKAYPNIAEDYKRGFAVLHQLPCDIFLGAHGGYFGLAAKYPKWKAGDQNVFIDPAGYKAYITEREQAFQAELARQQAAKP
jgi:metallo-beta-lactamase class B